ncbi:MAG: hypothetical protein JXA18_07860 [Chitinispirillaceae bacterium]|nr:hypothetical protein [Chitinispirillaceae bacterium]
MDREIVKTDRRYRRNLFLSYLVAIFLGVAFWKWGKRFFTAYMISLPLKERIEVMEMAGHLFLLLFIPAAIYLIVVGKRVCRYQAIPYPGMRVIKDTVIIRGKGALFRGRSMVALGTMLIVLVVISILATHFIVLRFKRHPFFRPFFYGSEV